MKGLDDGSITRDAAITAIVNARSGKDGKPKKSWGEVAETYDRAMQLHAMASALAGLYGAKRINEQNVPSSGKVVAKYGPMNEGPLPKGIADTFRSGTYSEVVTQQPTVLYRVYGGAAQEMGGYWTTAKPSGPVQSIIDSALNPQWGPATKVVKIEVLAGVKYYESVAAPQGGLVGGGSQVLFRKILKLTHLG
jgi:hypothetical protein